MHFDEFPNPSTFPVLEIELGDRGMFLFNFPTGSLLWITEVELTDSVDDLQTPQSSGWHRFPNFDTLDAQIASALKKINTNSHFKRKVSLEKQKAQMEDRFIQGRQIAYDTFG